MSIKSRPLTIMIHSYKGGTGKSAIAVNLAQYLVRNDQKRVLLIEQDTYGATFKNVFKIEPKTVWNDFYYSKTPFKEIITPTALHIDVICAKEAESELPIGEDPRAFHSQQLARLKKEKKTLENLYDCLILDTKPGYNLEMINNLVLSDVVILVARLDSDVIPKTIELYNTVYMQFKQKQVIIVENQVPEMNLSTENADFDADVKEAVTAWKQFTNQKTVITIPLKNEIASDLFRSKLVRMTNPFMDYIRQIQQHIFSH